MGGAIDAYRFMLEIGEQLIVKRRWAELERRAAEIAAAQGVPSDLLEEIKDFDLTYFCDQLTNMLIDASARAHALPDVVALYWEFDEVNDWANGVDLCSSFDPEDPEWAADSIGWVSGPDLPRFSAIYADEVVLAPVIAEAILVFLVARTYASLGRAYDRADVRDYPVGISIHDSNHIVQLAGAPGTVSKDQLC